MNVMKIDHIGIAVKNLDETLKFYTDVLGLNLQGTETVEVNADVENLNEILLAFTGTSSITKEEGVYQVSLRDGFHGKDLNRFLFDKNVVATHLVTKKKSLEKQFLEILANNPQK